ncbi:MAG: Ribosomal RNA small subunit methyltransferase E [Candidatus Magasanikbacteria bacterium GW2011_GWC2_40_17]|uniref:Ribosomal RNA small subunit methyltransferase E n=1 Tax=Candidatus Magasanikbacteria bacterium GW2011_GWA2_42_32 TaxID=1619039 RepID=A0A0G1D5J3_9BACT|nr:MAG: Ribosomal RNA small subunit methyltransferase E [Candidatus Magasanikbacteria bacterium GW2011_GWC2_40_17]KKS57313.1 MAG: Ribosomal RNA small subunit methyltransferase E [Candidatus Magasanikbacteria bacterium GW2011_GWA2_42_32]OGH85797.1 MAG: hypothetical protein A2294_02410 [Candidatus Magasanikbacteria bacterium RIFOXYB2_FULL_38_10]
MKIHRFFMEQNLKEEQVVLGDKEIIHQIEDVLKLQSGESIVLFNGDGFEYQGKIKELNREEIVLKEIKKTANNVRAKNQVTLFCAVLKKENFELVVQKAAEVGVTKIIPLITERTIKLNLNLERLKKIIKEATEQSGRNILPEITKPLSFKQVLDGLKKEDINLFFDITKDTDAFPKVQGRLVNIFIGPEGGWTDNERKLSSDYYFKEVNLGPAVLRAETAAIIATYLAAN